MAKKISFHKRATKKIKEAPKKWMSVTDVAAYLGISYVTVYRLVTEEKIPSFKIGKLWKFKASDLDKWIESGKAAE